MFGRRLSEADELRLIRRMFDFRDNITDYEIYNILRWARRRKNRLLLEMVLSEELDVAEVSWAGSVTLAWNEDKPASASASPLAECVRPGARGEARGGGEQAE